MRSTTPKNSLLKSRKDVDPFVSKFEEFRIVFRTGHAKPIQHSLLLRFSYEIVICI